jgi:hypothetical protein
MTKKQLIEKLSELPDNAEVVSEFADLGEGGNITSPIINVTVEDGKVVLVTDHAI